MQNMAAVVSDEDFSPLLSNEEVASAPPAVNGFYTVSQSTADQMPPPYNLNEPPPAYSSYLGAPAGVAGEPTVVCRVCHQLVFIRGRERQRVVKCSNCNEATPIKPPPTGKKYIRCPCNALLTCRASSARISCPRQNCKRVISVGAGPHMTSSNTAVPGEDLRLRVTCGHCNQTFVFRTTVHLARCPYCRKISSVGPRFAKSRALVFAVIGITFLAIGAGVTLGTYSLASESGGIYVSWIGAFVIAMLALFRSCYFCAMTVSQVEGQP